MFIGLAHEALRTWVLTHHAKDDDNEDADKKNCDRDGQPSPTRTLVELDETEQERSDIDLSSSTRRRRWFPPWEEMPWLIYINQLSFLFFWLGP